MNRHFWLLVSGCLWAFMMFLLFEREIRPYFDYQRPPSYRTLLQGRKEPELQRRVILANTVRIGEAESLIEPLASGGYLMRTRMRMKMGPFMNTSIALPDDRVIMTHDVRVDAAFQMVEFTLEARMSGVQATIRGQRQGDKLHVRYEVPILRLRDDVLVDFPAEATLADDFLPFQGGVKLSQGKLWKIRMVDTDKLMSVSKTKKLEFTYLYASVVEREQKVDGLATPTAAWKVEMRKEPVDEVPAYTIWVDDRGMIVKHVRMMPNKAPCTTILEEQRTLTTEEAARYSWTVEIPR